MEEVIMASLPNKELNRLIKIEIAVENLIENGVLDEGVFNQYLNEAYAANRILSIAQINGKLEIAILGEKFFVTDSYFEDLHDAVLPFDNIRDLKRIIDHIIDVEDNK